MDFGSNNADSNATVVVVSIISESNPPITPAKATGFSPSVMTTSLLNVRSTPSNVTNVSPSFARRT